MKSLSNIQQLQVPHDCLENSYNHFRASGENGLEGFVLWIGSFTDNQVFRVSDAIIPYQISVQSEYGLSVTIPSDELHRINKFLYKKSLRLVAQVHSHPEEAYHSPTDNMYPVATQEGSFSIVIPNFGKGTFSDDKYAVYRLLQGKWKRYTEEETKSLFIIEEAI